MLLVLPVAAAFGQDEVGGLTQKPGNAGCISETGGDETCADGSALDGATAIAISPDGAHVYVASFGSNAIAIFKRNRVTGALTQKRDAAVIDRPISIAASGDGKHVYVLSSRDTVAIFNRDSASGALKQKREAAGCVSDSGDGRCADGTALADPISIAISPDDANLYVTSLSGDAVAVFDRDAKTGTLEQKPAAAACISDSIEETPCTIAHQLGRAFAIAFSPDGRNLYLASGILAAILDRNPATGALSQQQTPQSCINDFSDDYCATAIAVDSPSAIAVSPDGQQVYIASFGDYAVAVFNRDPVTGFLSQKPGTDGCISQTGHEGACAVGQGLVGVNSLVPSPDGANLYAASGDVFDPVFPGDPYEQFGNAIAILDREAPDGVLSQDAAPEGCISSFGNAGACRVGRALDDARRLVVSPDGFSVYALSGLTDRFAHSIAIFDREVSAVCDSARAELRKAKRALRKAKRRLQTALADGAAGAISEARERVKKARKRVRRAIRGLEADCGT